MYHAAQHDGIDLPRSWVIGDGSQELTAGWRAGCALASIGSDPALGDGGFGTGAAVEAPSLAEALDEIRACAPTRP
ncbi:MAG: hypothetical protein CMJ84_03045 [Planctomycetes bacterium]|nr:hypothetical protein [Planctomycetota bacterium]